MRAAAAAVAMVAMAGCGGGSDEAPLPKLPGRIHLASPAFANGGRLPARFTCDGKGSSPPLRWSGVPARAKDLALLVEDPDAPGGPFVHWTAWTLPVEPDGHGRVLEDNVAPEMSEGENDFGDRGWGPPCPPESDAPHHYVFTVYALSRLRDPRDGGDPGDVRAAITEAATAEGRLVATYGR